MRSLFAKILLWFLATVLLTALGLGLTAALMYSEPQARRSPLGLLVSLQLAEAKEAWEEGGPRALARRLRYFEHVLGAKGALTDAEGRDLLTGEDRSQLIREALENPRKPLLRRGNLVLARRDREGRYWFLLELPRRGFYSWFLHPQFLWVIGLVILLCYLLARQLTQPLRRLQAALDRFGRGDFSARAGSDRKDELGDLSRAFDQMADRIQTLLTAERRLLRDISHELRSPLARLGVAIELARSGSDREKALDRIQKEADRLNQLVGELLQVTRAEGDPSSLVFETVDLNLLIEDVASDAALEAKARGVSVSVSAQDQVTIEGNPELLRRAIENVVRNAIRYAPEGTSVQITLEKAPVTIKVRDYGPGVPEEELGRIFEPFYRVEGDRSRGGGGAGLGLAIARRAVDLHHGSIQARNAEPGLEVRIALP